MENINKIVNTGMKFLIILLLAFVIIKQGQIIKMVYDERDKLDADPLAYGAQRYNIAECTCLAGNRTIVFSPSGSKIVISQKPTAKVNYSIDYTEVLYGTTGDN